MSEQQDAWSVEAVGLCDECRAGQLPPWVDIAPGVHHRPFSDDERDELQIKGRWARTGTSTRRYGPWPDRSPTGWPSCTMRPVG